MAKAKTHKAEPGKPRAIAAGPGGEVVIYEDPERQVRVDVRLDQETLWLNLNQLAQLFERDKSVISRHLRNIFREGELDRNATVAFFATVQQEGDRRVTRQVEYYNLDAILSVGYRVNSKRGTQSRIWATRVLRDHILKGYTVNARRLEELQQTIRVVAAVANRRALSGDEATALLRVVSEYSFALDLVDDYDRGRLPKPSGRPQRAKPITPEEARRIVSVLRERFGGSYLFGREKDDGLESALAAVFQTAAGRDVYPTLEKKQRIYYIFWSRIILSWTATNASARHCSCGFFKRTACCCRRKEKTGFPRKRSWR